MFGKFIKMLLQRHRWAIGMCVLINLICGIELALSSYAVSLILQADRAHNMHNWIVLIAVVLMVKQILFRSYDFLRDHIALSFNLSAKQYFMRQIIRGHRSKRYNSASVQYDLNTFVACAQKIFFSMFERFLIVFWSAIITVLSIGWVNINLAILIMVMLIGSASLAYTISAYSGRYIKIREKIGRTNQKHFKYLINNLGAYRIYNKIPQAMMRQNRNWQKKYLADKKLAWCMRAQKSIQGLFSACTMILPYGYYLSSDLSQYRTADLVFHYLLLTRFVGITWNLGEDINQYCLDLQKLKIIEKRLQLKKTVRLYPALTMFNANLLLNYGQRTLICGHSGIGKTTWLNALYDHLLKDTASKKILYLKQDEVFCWEKFKIFFPVFTEQLGHILDVLGFARYAYNTSFYNRTLSFGEQQRLLLLPCFLHSYDYILLDEPMRGVDTLMWHRIIQKILCYQSGATIWAASHAKVRKGIFNSALSLEMTKGIV